MNRELKHGEYYTCKRLRLLQYLREQGFMPYMTLPDVQNPKFNVWRFKNCAALESAIEAYFESLKH